MYRVLLCCIVLYYCTIHVCLSVGEGGGGQLPHVHLHGQALLVLWVVRIIQLSDGQGLVGREAQSTILNEIISNSLLPVR